MTDEDGTTEPDSRSSFQNDFKRLITLWDALAEYRSDANNARRNPGLESILADAWIAQSVVRILKSAQKVVYAGDTPTQV